MDMHSHPRERALLSQTALHEATRARARQLRAETLDSCLSAARLRLQAAGRALRDGARRTIARMAALPAAWPGHKAEGAAPCPH